MTSVVSHLDPIAKRIYLKEGVREYHPVEDIYRDVRLIRRTDETLRWFDMPVQAAGNVPKGGGKFTPRYAIFNQGWKVVPEDVTHALYVSGEQITDDGQSGPACIDTETLSEGNNVTIHYEPPAAELIRAEAEIEALTKSSYQGVVSLDLIKGRAGTDFPIGTRADPSNNIADSKIIAETYGIGTIKLQPGSYSFGIDDDLSGFSVAGERVIQTFVQIQAGALMNNTELRDMFITNSTFGQCYIYLNHVFVNTVSGFSGFAEGSLFTGTIGLCPMSSTFIVDCKSGCVGMNTNDLPVFDLSVEGDPVSPYNVAFRNWSGPIKFANSTNADNTICIDVTSGSTVILDESCTAGTIYIRGMVDIQNHSNMTVYDAGQMSDASVVDAVMAAAQASPIHADTRRTNGHQIVGTGASTNKFRSINYVG